jgi:POT family proton-dependent oligopeptide transporter
METVTKQPKALFLLFLVQMWECFSYYGMRVLLVLYMLEQLDYTKYEAFGIYALYTSMIEFGSLIGGYCADKYLGLRRAIMLGAFLMTCGHAVLSTSEIEPLFFLGLLLIVSGSGLFKTNIRALLGLFYEENDPKKDSAYTLFYTGSNLGGFLAAVMCGFIAQHFGWHAGFGIAAVGMLVSMLLLYFKQHLLEDKGLEVQKKSSINFVSLLNTSHTTTLLGLTFLLMIYFSMAELQGSMLMVYLQDFVDRQILGYEIPSSVLITANPITIFIVGPILAKITFINLKTKLILAFASMAMSFLCLMAGEVYSDNLVPVIPVLISFSFVAMGELLIAPTVFSYCSNNAPKAMQATLMGVVTLGFGFANLLSGKIGQFVSPETRGEYSIFFIGAALFMVLMCGLIQLSALLRRKSIVVLH